MTIERETQSTKPISIGSKFVFETQCHSHSVIGTALTTQRRTVSELANCFGCAFEKDSASALQSQNHFDWR